MSASSRRHYTLEDYLGVEETSAVRYEFLDGEIFAMAGGTPEHAALAAAIVVLIGARAVIGRVAVGAQGRWGRRPVRARVARRRARGRRPAAGL